MTRGYTFRERKGARCWYSAATDLGPAACTAQAAGARISLRLSLLIVPHQFFVGIALVFAWHLAFAGCLVAQNRADSLLTQLRNPNGKVMVVAHRGDWRNAPENSLAAIERAINMGVDIVEIDVRRTKDGHWVVIHDKSLDRTTTGEGRVSDRTLTEIRQLFLKNGYGVPTTHQVPTLSQVLVEYCDRVLIYVDKSQKYIPELHRLASKHGVAQYVLYYGDVPACELREKFGDFVFTKTNYLPKLNDNTVDARDYILGFQPSPAAMVTSFSAEDSKVVRLFPELTRRGIRIWASPLWPDLCGGHTDDKAVENDGADWGWLIEKGASILCTDRPAELLDYLRQRGLHD